MADIKTERLCIMFSKLKHRFDGKSKMVVSLLATAALLCGFTGCNKNETDNSVPLSSLSIPQSVSTDKSEVSQSSEFNSDVSSEENTSLIKPEIVMDGNLITLPCKVEEIDGITIDREYSFAVVSATENVDEYSTAYFYYNGKRAGLIRLDGDCSEKADLGKETVVGIDFYDNIPVSCFGLTFQSKREDIIDKLGNPDNASDTLVGYYIDGNPADHINFDLDSNGRLIAVRIYLGLA